MCEYASNKNSNLNIRIHTNGGARSKEWWRNFPKKLPKNHFVIFGIDGLEDTHSLYRIGTTYNQVIENAKEFINAGGMAEWVFIKFKHNEHQVDEARRRAEELGFKVFTVKNSTRFLKPKFSVYDKNGNTVYFLEPPSDNKVNLINEDVIKNFSSWVDESTIHCYVQKNKELYIDATKTLFPCCFLASAPYNYFDNNSDVAYIRQTIKDQYNDLISYFNGIDNLNLLTRSIKDIVESSQWQTAWEIYWNDKKLITCARTCGKNNSTPISQPKDQFIKKINFK
jgi:hypothetical protein